MNTLKTIPAIWIASLTLALGPGLALGAPNSEQPTRHTGDEWVLAFQEPTLRTQPLEISSRRQLFVDNYVIGDLTGSARRQLHQLQPATTKRTDVAMTWNDNWEGSWTRYSGCLQDQGQIKTWYTGCHTDGNSKNRTCYAISQDGLTFHKPSLGIYDWKGSTANNVLFDQHSFKNAEGKWIDQSHNFAPFVDMNPAADPAARYKAFGGLGEGLHSNTGLFAFQSADGVHWKLTAPTPILSNAYRFDSHNQGFWDAVRKRYAVYFRNLRNGDGQIGIHARNWRRDIMVSFSEDFTHWSKPQWLVYYRNDGQPGMNLEHLYTNEIKPYPRAPHLYLGFPARLIAGSRVEPMFMTSRDGIHFYRWMDHPMIPLTAPADRNQNRSNHIWQEMVEIPGEPRKYSMYASENLGIRGHHPDGSFPRLRRFAIRKDGFVSLRASGQSGVLLTKPLIFQGNTLMINYRGQPNGAGYLKVEIQDRHRKPIPNFTIEDCDRFKGDEIDGKVTWNGKADLSALAGKVVYLRFLIRDAELFSFKFGNR